MPCETSGPRRGRGGIRQALRAIRETNRPFGPVRLRDAPELFAYCSHYRFPLETIRRDAGYLDSSRGDYRIFTHLLAPERVRGTILLVHGYLTHSGLLADAARFFLALDYAVLLFDLPGHGLSSGASADIPSFSVYADAVAAALAAYRGGSGPDPGPIHAAGHSTGCAALLEHMLRTSGGGLGAVVFLAPLIRSRGWKVSRLGEKILPRLSIRSVPRIFRTTSSDREYLRFIRANDPLQCRTVPFSWLFALAEWNENLPTAATHRFSSSILVVQGTRDGVVDFRYNLRRLEAIVPELAVRMIEGAKHDLPNEGPPVREQVFEIMLEAVESAAAGSARRT